MRSYFHKFIFFDNESLQTVVCNFFCHFSVNYEEVGVSHSLTGLILFCVGSLFDGVLQEELVLLGNLIDNVIGKRYHDYVTNSRDLHNR